MSYMSIMGNMNFFSGNPFGGVGYTQLNIFQTAKLQGTTVASGSVFGGNIFSSGPFGGGFLNNCGLFGSNLFSNGLFGGFSYPSYSFAMPNFLNFSNQNRGNIFTNPAFQKSSFVANPLPIFSLPTKKLTQPSTSLSSFGTRFGSITSKRKTQSVSSLSYSTNASSLKNIQWWKNLGYNPERGRQLMNYMRPHATGFRGNCVGVVREAINEVYYGGAKHYARFGKACNVGRDFLSTDRHFRKVTGVNLAQINPADIPEGVIIIYGPGYSRKHPECGHGEISNGNGRGYSDGITHIKNSGRQLIKELWIPV